MGMCGVSICILFLVFFCDLSPDSYINAHRISIIYKIHWYFKNTFAIFLEMRNSTMCSLYGH